MEIVTIDSDLPGKDLIPSERNEMKKMTVKL